MELLVSRLSVCVDVHTAWGESIHLLFGGGAPKAPRTMQLYFNGLDGNSLPLLFLCAHAAVWVHYNVSPLSAPNYSLDLICGSRYSSVG